MTPKSWTLNLMRFLPALIVWLHSSLGSSQVLVVDPDDPYSNYVRACLEPEISSEEELRPYKLTPPTLISGEDADRESVFKLRFDRALNKVAEPSRVSLGMTSMEARILAVPLYSNVYLSNQSNRVFFSAGGGVLKIGMAGGGYELNGRSGLLLRFSAHAAYSDRFYPIAGMRIGRSF